ncbi:MAG: hypothetical protein ABFS32_08215 [Bacteroidota bacterium]
MKEIVQNIKRNRVSESIELKNSIPCLIVDTKTYSFLAATTYVITNLDMGDKHTRFELWDEQGYIYTFEMNTMDYIVSSADQE